MPEHLLECVKLADPPLIICTIKHSLFKFFANKFDFKYGSIGARTDLLSSCECITPKLDYRSLHMKKIMGS